MSPAALAADGDNALVWRFRPQRLDGEQIHDAIFSATGVMDLSAGGPGYLVYEPNPTGYVKVYIPAVQGPSGMAADDLSEQAADAARTDVRRASIAPTAALRWPGETFPRRRCNR